MDHSAVLKTLRSTKSRLRNYAGGEWRETKKDAELMNPLNGTLLLTYPDTQPDELEPFLAGLRSCPKSGLHNPFKNIECYRMLGEVSFRAARLLEDTAIADYFALLIQSVMPKSYQQCLGEVTVVRQFLRLLHFCGLPHTDVDLIHCRGPVMQEFVRQGKDIIRLVQFTGSSTVAEELAVLMEGKIRIEDAGFDWKIIGPDYSPKDVDYVAWQCDQDAYAASGQKCSAQSLLFLSTKWGDSFMAKLRERAARRNLRDLTIGPVLTWRTNELLDHVQKLAAIPGAKTLFGGKALIGHQIPDCYGAIEPTAVFVPIRKIASPEYFELVTTEVFGPVQVITKYRDRDIPLVLELCERMQNHLTAAVVSRDQEFIDRVLGRTVNGTTYVGIRARTTGAPQNHWFGPSGDPRAAGIGTPEAVVITWSAPRCIIRDTGPIDYSVDLSVS